MKLYYMPAACSLAPHIVLRELRIDAVLVRVDNKTHRTEDGSDFTVLNPFGYVPLLDLGYGTLLREGPAILQYLADLRPESAFAPAAGSMARYRLQEWLNFLSSEIHKGFIPLLYAQLAGRYAIDTARPKLEERLAWVDAELAGRDYLMGTCTVADAYLYALVQWGRAEWLVPTYRANINYDGLHHLRDWYLKMRARPAVREALSAEGLR